MTIETPASRIESAATALVAALHDGRKLDALPGSGPATLDEAYAVQDAILGRTGRRLEGFAVAGGHRKMRANPARVFC
jgi:2-keto-4-pentenoate hydratase